MSLVSFTVPGNARGQGRPRATIRGAHASVYKDSKSVVYESLVRLAAEQAMRGRAPFTDPIGMRVIVRVTPPASVSKKQRTEMLLGMRHPTKKPDLSNIIKSIEDGCNGVAFADDKQVVSLTASKSYAEVAGVDVVVRSLDDALEIATQWGMIQTQGRAA